MLARLHAPIKDYQWGSASAISDFHRQAPKGSPEAEQWFGGHPLAGTTILQGEGDVPFGEWLKGTSTSFPLLVKLLAAATPLSIQVHPNTEQAARGFEAEERKGVPRESAARNYRDSSAKPELMISLSPAFRALVGFHTPKALAQRIQRWEEAGLDGGTADSARRLAGMSTRQCVEWIVFEEEAVRRCVSGLSEWALGEIDLPLTDVTAAERAVMASLASAHPGDKGLVFGLLMHHVALGHGEAVFVDAGVVHAYIEGFGLEVMLPSDNVVRAGLTAKHTDGDEFLALATCEPVDRPPVVDPLDDGSVSHYSGFRAPFVVRRLTSGGSVLLDHTSAVIVFEDAHGEVSGAVSSHSATRGDVVFVSEDEQEISFRGEGSLWVVSAKISQV